MPGPVEEGIVSRGVKRLIFVVLGGLAIGFGVFALVSGLQSADDKDTAAPVKPAQTPAGATTSPSPPPDKPAEPVSSDIPEDPFSSESLRLATDLVRREVGGDAELTKLTINPVLTEFHVRQGNGARGFQLRAGEDKLQAVLVRVVGTGSLDEFSFPLSKVDPDSVDRMVAEAKRISGAGDFEPNVLALEKALVNKRLRWLITAEGGGRIGLTYIARPDGRRVNDANTGPRAAPPSVPPDVEEQFERGRKRLRCVQQAGGDIEKLQRCGEI